MQQLYNVGLGLSMCSLSTSGHVLNLELREKEAIVVHGRIAQWGILPLRNRSVILQRN